MKFYNKIAPSIPYFYILVFTIIIFLYGNNNIEDYAHGTLTSQYYREDFTNYFSFFYDFYGPGITLPLGNAPFLHPLNFFLYDLRIYYTLFVFIHLLGQVHFTIKIFKLFKIKYETYLLGLFIVFSLTNINYSLSDDWISAFFSYSLFPGIFYFLIKIIKKQKFLDYYKFTFFFCFWMLNGHVGIISIYLIFLFIYLILSINNFFHLKKIFNVSFFIFFIFIILILADHFYYLLIESNKDLLERHIQGPYSKRPYAEIFFPFESILSWTRLNRLPGNPIIIYLSLFISLKIILAFLKKEIKKKRITLKHLKILFLKFYFKIKHNYNFKLSFLFLLFFLFSITPILRYTYIVSSIWMVRDIFLLLGILLIFNNYKKFNKYFVFLLNFLMVFYTLLFLFINLIDINKKNEKNIYNHVNNNSDITNTLRNLNILKKDLKRIYLSPGLYPFILRGYEQDGIFSNTDLIRYNLAPFNGHFKNNSVMGFGDQKYSMNGSIESHYDYINNNFFLDLYKIEYLLITEKEINNLKNSSFKLISKIDTNKKISQKEVAHLKSVNKINITNNLNEYEKLILLKRDNKNYSINIRNFEVLKKNILSCNKIKIDCMLENKSLFDYSEHIFERIENGKYFIGNIYNDNLLFIPFLFAKNWKSNNGKFYELDDFGMFYKNKSKTDTAIIRYTDLTRSILKIISFFSIVVLIFFPILKK